MKKINKFLLALTLMLAVIGGIFAGCGSSAPEITLDREDASQEVPFGEVYSPPSYIILADGEDTGLTAKVKTDGVTGPDGKPVQVSYGRFTPLMQGEYTLIYISNGLPELYPDHFSEEMTWTIKINAVDKTGPQTTVSAEDANYKVVWVGKTVPVPEFTASDPSEVDTAKTAIYVQQPDGTEVKVENGFYTTKAAGTHKWLYKVWDKVGNASVREYEFNVIDGPKTVIDDCVGYFDQEFGLRQITAYNANASVDADFVWKDIDGQPKGAVVMEQSINQWDIRGTSEFGGIGIDGSMQIELYGPYIEQLAEKYDAVYLPMHNPNDYPIEVRVWFDKCINIPAGGTINYVFPTSNYERGSNVLMYAGDYTVIHDVYRTTFSCGMASGSLFSFTNLFSSLVTDDELIAYYAETENIAKEEAQKQYAALDWTGHENLLIDYLKKSEKWGVEKTEEELHKHMLPKGTKWYVGPMYGVNQPKKDTDSVKYLADLGYVGGVSNVSSYGDRTLLYTNAPEFVDAEKKIDGAVLYQAGTYTNELGSGVAIRLQNLRYTRKELALKMGKDDYISIWLKKPASCKVNFTVMVGYTAYELKPTNEWQELKLYRKDIGSQFGGTDGIDYLYGDSGYESGGEWITTYPNDIILRILGDNSALVYDGIELAIAGVTLNLAGDASAERFNMTVSPDTYSAVVEGDEIAVPTFTSSWEAADSGKIVADKKVYLKAADGDPVLMEGTSVTVDEAGEYEWIFRTYDASGTQISENKVSFTVYAETKSLDVPYTADHWVSNHGTFAEGSGKVVFTGENTWDAIYVGLTGLNDADYVFDYVEFTVKNLSSASIDVCFSNDYEWITIAPGETGTLRITAEKLASGGYTDKDGNKVTGINGLTLHLTDSASQSDNFTLDNGFTNLGIEASCKMYRVGGEVQNAPVDSAALNCTASNWIARSGDSDGGSFEIQGDTAVYTASNNGWAPIYVGLTGLENEDYSFDYVEITVKNLSSRDICVFFANDYNYTDIDVNETVVLKLTYKAIVGSGRYVDVNGNIIDGLNGLSLHLTDPDHRYDDLRTENGYTSIKLEISVKLCSYK